MTVYQARAFSVARKQWGSPTPATGGGNGQVWVNSSTHVYHKEG
jgi:hypothetical protein